jgi:hypothetical protein
MEIAPNGCWLVFHGSTKHKLVSAYLSSPKEIIEKNQVVCCLLFFAGFQLLHPWNLTEPNTMTIHVQKPEKPDNHSFRQEMSLWIYLMICIYVCVYHMLIVRHNTTNIAEWVTSVLGSLLPCLLDIGRVLHLLEGEGWINQPRCHWHPNVGFCCWLLYLESSHIWMLFRKICGYMLDKC